MQRTESRHHVSHRVAGTHGLPGGFSTAVAVLLSAVVILMVLSRAALGLTLSAMEGTPQTSPVNTPFADLVVEVLDEGGVPVEGALVAFQAPSLGASVTFPSSSIDFTDAEGRASVPVRANLIAGSFSVMANTGGAPSVPFVLTNAPGAPAVVKTHGGATRTTVVDTPFGIDFRAEVRDQYSNLVYDASVTFTAPASGATALFPGGSTTVSDASGVATAPALANTVAGVYEVVASSGAATTATFTVTNKAALAAVIITTGSPQATPVNLPFPQPLGVEVSDEFGNIVVGATVIFSAPSTGASAVFPDGSSVVTDAAGRANITAQANTIAGTFLATASVPNAVSNTFQLQNLSFSDVSPATPGRTGFVAASPNPFNPSTVIAFDLAQEGLVRLDVVDLRGRHVRTLLAEEWFGAGRQQVSWDGRDERSTAAASGVYRCLLRTATGLDVLPLVLLK